MPIGIPNICWYTMPSNCTYVFSMRKVRASHNSVQVQYVYESYFLLEKIPDLSYVQMQVFVMSNFEQLNHYNGIFNHIY